MSDVIMVISKHDDKSALQLTFGRRKL